MCGQYQNLTHMIMTFICTIIIHRDCSSYNELVSPLVVITVAVLSAIAFPVIFILGFPPRTCQIVASFCFVVSAFDIIFVYFGPKIQPLVKHEIKWFSRQIFSTDEAVHPEEDSDIESVTSTDNNEKYENPLVMAGKAALKHKDIDEQNRICLEQIGLWQGMLLNLGEEGYSKGSQSSNSKIRDSHVSKGLSSSFHSAQRSSGTSHSGFAIVNRPKLILHKVCKQNSQA